MRHPLALLFAVLFVVFAFGCLSAISGCSTVETLDRTKTVQVSVPVAVACVYPDDVPELPAPTPIDVSRATTSQKAAALAADAEQLGRFSRTAAALIQHCVSTGGKP